MTGKSGNVAQLEQVDRGAGDAGSAGDVQEDRRQPLAAWNVTEHEYALDACVPQLVARQAAITPDAIALIAGEQSLSYRELNGQANQLAHYLQA